MDGTVTISIKDFELLRSNVERYKKVVKTITEKDFKLLRDDAEKYEKIVKAITDGVSFDLKQYEEEMQRIDNDKTLTNNSQIDDVVKEAVEKIIVKIDEKMLQKIIFNCIYSKKELWNTEQMDEALFYLKEYFEKNGKIKINYI